MPISRATNSWWTSQGGHQPNTAQILNKIMPPRHRKPSYKKYEQKDPLLDLDTKIRASLTNYRDKCYSDDWWPRQGSEDEALLVTYGLTEFTQGIVEEEERFRRDWEGR